MKLEVSLKQKKYITSDSKTVSDWSLNESGETSGVLLQQCSRHQEMGYERTTKPRITKVWVKAKDSGNNYKPKKPFLRNEE